MSISPLKVATGELICFGIVGAILDSAYEILEEVDLNMASDLEVIMDRVMTRFRAAEKTILELDGFGE